MNPLTLRILPTQSLDGATQMSLDEALLHSSEQGIASFRLYSWSEPTLSLGYFQNSSDRLEGISWVRRSSGGGAIVHHHDLTYCLALPGEPVWKSQEPWTCRMHHLLTRVLRKFAVESRSVVCGEELKRGPFLCFEHHTPGDVVIEAAQREKIIGSAQRRHRNGTMQHGSILLAQSPFALSLPGIRELMGVNLDLKQLEAEIRTELQNDTGWHLVPDQWTEAELAKAAEIRQEKYGNLAWNGKR